MPFCFEIKMNATFKFIFHKMWENRWFFCVESTVKLFWRQSDRQASSFAAAASHKTSFFFSPFSFTSIVFIYIFSLCQFPFFFQHPIHPPFLCLLPACNITRVMFRVKQAEICAWVFMHINDDGKRATHTVVCIISWNTWWSEWMGEREVYAHREPRKTKNSNWWCS